VLICGGSTAVLIQTSVTAFVPLRVMSSMISRVVCTRHNDGKKRIRKRDRNVSFLNLMVLQLIFPHCTNNSRGRQ
jgi:hypothetical protein